MKTCEIEDYDDIEFEGDNSVWKVICKEWSNEGGYVDKTSAMSIPDGVILRTQRYTDDTMSESLVMLQGYRLEENDGQYKIVK